MEDYKQKYEIAIKKAKEELKTCGTLDCDAARQIFRFFPELKESEDERIRKGLIEYFLHYPDHEITYYDLKADFVISWLEKQGEQKSAWSEEDETGWTNTMIMIEEVASNHYTKDSIKLVIDWLKSLKERYTWKPSDEQMKQLGWVAEQNKDNMIGKELMPLYQDLKKLKGK